MAPLVVMSVVLFLICLQFGTQWIGLSQIIDIVGQVLREWTVESDRIGTTGVILIQVRLPRVLLGFLVGACLASVGVVLQALLRNPLADPYVLGVSSGAALGVALAILLGVGATVVTFSVLPLCGFAGGLLSLVVVYRMALSYGRLPIHALLLAGVILNAIFSAMIMFVTSIMEPNRSVGTMTWLMGTLTAPSYPALAILACYLLGGLFLLLKQARRLNVLTLGRRVCAFAGNRHRACQASGLCALGPDHRRSGVGEWNDRVRWDGHPARRPVSSRGGSPAALAGIGVHWRNVPGHRRYLGTYACSHRQKFLWGSSLRWQVDRSSSTSWCGGRIGSHEPVSRATHIR